MIHLASLVLWSTLWILGGIWLASSAFRLERGALLLAGLGIGLATENLFANLFGRFLPLPAAFWVAAGCTLLLGLGLALRDGPRALLRLPWDWGGFLSVTLVSLLAFGLGRGFGIFDEFLQLPTISLLATGVIPPRFALDPSVPYDYHYFMLLFSAQVVRIGGLHIWTALDLVRGLATGLAVTLMFIWTRRLTHSKTAGLLGSVFILFASGSRWLLLLLPTSLLKSISSGLTLLGSGLASGGNLGKALVGPWVIEGGGPIPFPFAFANGIFPAGILSQFVANGLTETAFTLVLLLTFTRWRSTWRGILVSVLVISAGMLLNEAGVLLEIGGLGLAVIITVVRQRTFKLPHSLWGWLGAVTGGQLLGAWQGGALAGITSQWLGLSSSSSYHTIDFSLSFPPTVVSSHLGVLSLVNPGQALVALAELGPLLLALPLLVIWGWKAVRIGRWYEAALVGEALLALGMLFVHFTGSEGIRNTSRLYRFMFVLSIFAVPLGWNWAVRRAGTLRWVAAAAAGLSIFGGLVLFGIELPALQRPVSTYFLTNMDVSMSDRFWNKLEKDALIFDAVMYRAPTVLGRFTNSSITWYSIKPEWGVLLKEPYPKKIRAAGYSYAYMDNFYFRNLSSDIQQAWNAPCVKVTGEIVVEGLWRRLYNIQACQP
jgi:hypothetical protein